MAKRTTTSSSASAASNGAAVWGMTLGIASLFRLYLALPLAITGLICSIIGLKKSKVTGVGRGYALTGLICSIFSILLWILVVIFYVVFLGLAYSSGFDGTGMMY